MDAAAMIVATGPITPSTEGCPSFLEGDALDGSTSYNTRGQWGGLIVLGDATTNFGGPPKWKAFQQTTTSDLRWKQRRRQLWGVDLRDIRHGGTQLGCQRNQRLDPCWCRFRNHHPPPSKSCPTWTTASNSLEVR